MKQVTNRNSKVGGTYYSVYALGGRMGIAILALMLSSVLTAKNYRVSSASELTAISSSLLAGDTVKLSTGTWQNEKLILKASGTQQANVVLTVEEIGKTILSGTSQLKLSGEYITVDGLRFEGGSLESGAVIEFRKSSSDLAHNCRLTNTTILNYNPSDKDVDYKWVSVYGTNNRVDHCHFEGKTHSGTTLVVWLGDEPNHTQIDNNYFGARPDLGYNGGETIRIGTSTNSMKDSRAIVEHNLFEACDGEIEIISNKSCFNTYRYNTFRNNNGCLTLRHGNDCEVYGNYFIGENKASGGVRIIGERHKVYNNYFEHLKGDDYRSAICIMNGVPDSPLNRYFQVKEALVAYNTIVNCEMPIIIGAGKDSEKSLAPVDCVIANNVVDATSGNKNITIEDEPANMLWEGNFINGDKDDEPVATGISFGNPLLAKVAHMWRPQTASPILNNAVGDYDFITSDIEQDDRASLKTSGCDNATVNADWHPLNKEDVGPYSELKANTSITKIEEVNDMVELRMYNGRYLFQLLNNKYEPVNYWVSDLSGRTLSKGKIENELSLLTEKDKIYVAVFISDKKYIQQFKLINQLRN